jgi:hypothetical protein
LKNPSIKYIHIYSYKDNIQEQYLVPAIVFEIDNEKGAEYNYGETITIPLLKDFYKYNSN